MMATLGGGVTGRDDRGRGRENADTLAAMRRFLTRIAPALHLTRVTMAFSVIANTWFVILWTRANDQEGWHSELNERPLWLLLGASAMVGVGRFAFGGGG